MAQPKLVRRAIPSASIVLTEHALIRMKERIPGFELPEIGSFVRLLTMRDTFHDKTLIVLRVKGGAILGKWTKDNKFIVVTVFSEQTFHNLQKRAKSRFIPVDTHGYEIAEIIYPKAEVMTNAV